MGLIEELNEVAECIRLNNLSYTRAVAKARGVFGVEEDPYSYGKDLANVFAKIAERIGKEYVPVPLDMDGEPVLDFLGTYYGADGTPEHVIGYRSTGAVLVSDEDEGYRLVLPEDLSKNPPDTQERIDEGKKIEFFAYWGCEGANCEKCPAKVEGETPKKRYGLASCAAAMGYDLALRQARLDAAKGEQ